MVIFAILDLMFNMTREDLINMDEEITDLSDKYNGLVEGDTSFDDESSYETSTDEDEVLGEIEDIPPVNKR